MTMRRHHWLAIWVLILLCLGACGDSGAVFAPDAATPFIPPASYLSLWHETEECAGHTANYGAVSWYVLPAGASWSSEGRNRLGAWRERGNRITLRAEYVDDAKVVRHEMLHAILHDGRHSVEYFFTRCGELVAQPSIQ